MWLTEVTVALVAVVFISQTSPLIILPTPSADCARVRANGHFQTGSHHRQEGQGTRYALPDSNGPMLYLPSTVFFPKVHPSLLLLASDACLYMQTCRLALGDVRESFDISQSPPVRVLAPPSEAFTGLLDFHPLPNMWKLRQSITFSRRQKSSVF